MSDVRRIDWLDALRGWAIGGVVLVHAGQAVHNQGLTGKIASAGQYGVQLFFLVSALTISMTYENHIARFGDGPRAQLAWLTKRVFRIMPLYYFGIIIYTLEDCFIYSVNSKYMHGHLSASDIVVNMLFLHTWVPAANNSVVPGGWSIGVEMFFYMLVPFLWRTHPEKRRVALLALAAVLMLLATLLASERVTGTLYIEDNSYFYFWFPTQAPVLIIGIIFFICINKRSFCLDFGPTRSFACLCAYVSLVYITLYFGTNDGVAPVLAPTLVAVAFLCLVGGMSIVKSIIINNYAVYLGRISFSIYMIHFLVLDFFRLPLKLLPFGYSNFMLPPVFLAVLVAAAFIASFSKKFIEDPGIRYGHGLALALCPGPEACRSSASLDRSRETQPPIAPAPLLNPGPRGARRAPV